MLRAIFWGFVVAGLLALFTTTYAANPLMDARAATRQLQIWPEGQCSAVVIAPETALTAKHCVDGGPLSIDGKPAFVVEQHPTNDVAKLHVPDLACPCVAVSAIRPMMDEKIVGVGWLYGRLLFTTHGEYLGYFLHEDVNEHFALWTGHAGRGMSGGGVFRVFVTGDITLVGIIAGTLGGYPSLYTEVSEDAMKW